MQQSPQNGSLVSSNLHICGAINYSAVPSAEAILMKMDGRAAAEGRVLRRRRGLLYLVGPHRNVVSGNRAAAELCEGAAAPDNGRRERLGAISTC